MEEQRANSSADLPVVVVHGFLATTELMAPFYKNLASRGFDVHTTDLSFLCIQDVRTLAAEAADTVEQVLHRTGAAKCNLVGVSMGGIIAVYYVKFLGGSRTVEHVVCVGSPFRGSWAAVAGLMTVPFLGWVSRGLWQSLPRSTLLADLVEAPMPDGVQATSIGIEGDPIAPASRCELPGAENVTLAGIPILGHQWTVFSNLVSDTIASVLRKGGTP